MMLWFFNGSSGPPRFIGIHCDQRPEDYQLIVLYPDGSEETEHFEDSHTLLDAAKKLGKDLSRLGWEACPTAAGAVRRES
ncbi:MAG: hypothetical protein O3A25_00490 [Acidobacteria bacterium]|nr:hypothetical protein [Acidobacteriota bacterium]